MNRLIKFHENFGFTLVELLVSLGILALLLSIVVVAINPAKQFAQANNTKRRNDVVEILNAVDQYLADNRGSLPSQITTSVQHISKSGADLCTALTVTVKYISALPSDPNVNGGSQITSCSSSYDTGYTITKDSSNKVTVATDPSNEQLGQHISVTR